MIQVIQEDIGMNFIIMENCQLDEALWHNDKSIVRFGKTEQDWVILNLSKLDPRPTEFCVGILTSVETKEINEHAIDEINARIWVPEEVPANVTQPHECYPRALWDGNPRENEYYENGTIKWDFEQFHGIVIGSKMTNAVNCMLYNTTTRDKGWCKFDSASLPEDFKFKQKVNGKRKTFVDTSKETRGWIPAEAFCPKCEECRETNYVLNWAVRLTSSRRRKLTETEFKEALENTLEGTSVLYGGNEVTPGRIGIDVQEGRRRLCSHQADQTNEDYGGYGGYGTNTHPEDDCVVEQFTDIKVELELPSTTEEICNELAENIKVKPESDDPNLEVLRVESSCHPYHAKQNLVWIMGGKDEACIAVCSPLRMVTLEMRLPSSQEEFESIMISYEKSIDSDEVATKLSEPKSVMEYCTGGVSEYQQTYPAPEWDTEDNQCYWQNKYITRDVNPDDIVIQKPLIKSRRRICPCGELQDRSKDRGISYVNENPKGSQIETNLGAGNDSLETTGMRPNGLHIAVLLTGVGLAVLYHYQRKRTSPESYEFLQDEEL